jgi:hypothetical protein
MKEYQSICLDYVGRFFYVVTINQTLWFRVFRKQPPNTGWQRNDSRFEIEIEVEVNHH